MWSTLILLLYLLTILSIVVIVIVENRSSYKALSWIVVVTFLPIVGAVLYMMFGRDMHIRGYRKNPTYRAISEAPKKYALHPDCLPERCKKMYGSLVKQIESDNESVLLAASQIDIYTNGMDKFAALFKDIAAARKHIHIEYYIIQDDELGERLLRLLTDKAREGVEVRLLFDAIGSKGIRSRFFIPLIRSGGRVRGFRPFHFPYVNVQINSRNHRKIVVIDGEIGYMGGMNVANRYAKGNELGPWRDTHFRICGTAVAGLQRAFLRDWSYSSLHKLYREDLFPPLTAAPRSTAPFKEGSLAESSSPVVPETPGSTESISNRSDGVIAPLYTASAGMIPMQFTTNGPIGRARTIERSLLKALALAEDHIYIETPYFLPTDLLLSAIVSAALRGVRVCLMMPQKGDSGITTLASRSYLSEVLCAGVEVFLYRGGFLHSKLLTIDSKIASIGSTNMDFRSLELNYEINAFIYSADTTERVERLFEQDLAFCTAVHYAQWQKRPRGKRFLESLFRLLAPML